MPHRFWFYCGKHEKKQNKNIVLFLTNIMTRFFKKTKRQHQLTVDHFTTVY